MEDALLLRKVLRIQRAHLGEDRVEFGAVLAGELSLERDSYIAFCRFVIELFGTNKFFCFPSLLGLGEGEESLYICSLCRRSG